MYRNVFFLFLFLLYIKVQEYELPFYPVKKRKGGGNLLLQNKLYCGVVALMNLFSEHDFGHVNVLKEVLENNKINLYFYCIKKLWKEYNFTTNHKISLVSFHTKRKRYINEHIHEIYKPGIGDYDFYVIYHACKKYCDLHHLKMEKVVLEDAKENAKRNRHFLKIVRSYNNLVGVIILFNNHYICLKKINHRLYKFDSLSQQVEKTYSIQEPDVFWCIYKQD